MSNLTCPVDGHPLDSLTTTVERPVRGPVAFGDESLEMTTYWLPTRQQVVLCSRCEFGATVKDLLAGKVTA